MHFVLLTKSAAAMVIEIKKTMNKAAIQRAMNQLPANHKRLSVSKIVGVVKWPEDPVSYQKRMRDEW